MADSNSQDNKEPSQTQAGGVGTDNSESPTKGEKSAAQPSAAAQDQPEPVQPAAAKPKAAAKSQAAAAKAADSSLMSPTNVALMLAAAGLLCCWKASDLYRSGHHDFYSISAWLFLISFFLVTVSAFHFLGPQLNRLRKDDSKTERSGQGPYRDGKVAGAQPTRFWEALVPALPFFALYAVIFWEAWDKWSVLYSGSRSWIWMFVGALALVSWGAWHGLSPPSLQDVKADRLPTRRVIMLLMIPFVCVYGMIWLAERAGH